MAVFICVDGAQLCLAQDQPQVYSVVKKILIRDKDNPRKFEIRTEAAPAQIHHGRFQKVRLDAATGLVDFSKYLPEEGKKFDSGIKTVPVGTYTFLHLSIAAYNDVHCVVVLRGTTLGLAKAGLEAMLARRKRQEDELRLNSLVLSRLSKHYGIPVVDLTDDFRLPDVEGLGKQVGTGLYHSWCPKFGSKPVLIRPGIKIVQIFEQMK
jgi:hypothetical protein